MNKKGATQKILLFAFYLIMALIIIYSLSSYLSNYINGSEFNKEFLAKDFGLAVDTLSFSPDKIDMIYNFPEEIMTESKNAILNIKLKDLEIPKKYGFISKIDDFSTKSEKINVKKEEKIKIS